MNIVNKVSPQNTMLRVTQSTQNLLCSYKDVFDSIQTGNTIAQCTGPQTTFESEGCLVH